MGTPGKPIVPERTIINKFVTWLNGIDFEDDAECHNVLTEIISECNARLGEMKGNVEQTSRD